jgi:hypothetical protein
VNPDIGGVAFVVLSLIALASCGSRHEFRDLPPPDLYSFYSQPSWPPLPLESLNFSVPSINRQTADEQNAMRNRADQMQALIDSLPEIKTHPSRAAGS